MAFVVFGGFGVYRLEAWDQPVPGQFGAGVAESIGTTLGNLIRVVHDPDQGIGERVGVVRGDEPAGWPSGIEVDHRR